MGFALPLAWHWTAWPGNKLSYLLLLVVSDFALRLTLRMLLTLALESWFWIVVMPYGRLLLGKALLQQQPRSCSL